MAGGWSKDGDVQQQIDQSVEDAVARARSQLRDGEGLADCEACGEPIPLARREAVPGARRCLPCQEEADAAAGDSSLFNRRGSKDSQLR